MAETNKDRARKRAQVDKFFDAYREQAKALAEKVFDEEGFAPLADANAKAVAESIDHYVAIAHRLWLRECGKGARSKK